MSGHWGGTSYSIPSDSPQEPARPLPRTRGAGANPTIHPDSSMRVKHRRQEKIYRGKLGADRPTLIGQLGRLGNERFLRRVVAGLAGLVFPVFIPVNRQLTGSMAAGRHFRRLPQTGIINWEGFAIELLQPRARLTKWRVLPRPCLCISCA
jgi:hypothetical protein